ncbi:hypothetical protein CYMTET_42511 [Cymbomonas tetramitiformis]|uniref:DNA 3'-5' helicase n=1 Tax=Cymbomonas tetramitiformis TaxID=36881 RepID=A0AAE0C429_9CHLO|nr:hypothetical protein CYMTET_42511 [Cymbomonas tetramitiformis]
MSFVHAAGYLMFARRLPNSVAHLGHTTFCTRDPMSGRYEVVYGSQSAGGRLAGAPAVASPMALAGSSQFTGRCERKTVSGHCSCHPARYRQPLCPKCQEPIEHGHCITNFGGWAHTECPGDGQRGTSALRTGLQRLAKTIQPAAIQEAPHSSPNAKRRLSFSSTSSGDAHSGRMESVAGTSGRLLSKRARFSKFWEDDDDADSDDEVDEKGEAEEENVSDEGSDEAIVIDAEDEEEESTWMTPEQSALAKHVPCPGDIVRVNARAGTGKTTVAAAVATEWVARDPDTRLLYVVFSKQAKREATKSLKFPKKVQILTAHSLALRRLKFFETRFGDSDFGTPSMKQVAESLGLHEDVASALDRHMDAAVQALRGNKRRFDRIVSRVALYVMKSLERFCQSAAPRATHRHVFRKVQLMVDRNSRAGRKERWREALSSQDYVAWVNALFDRMTAQLRGVPGGTRLPVMHDVYMKVYQLEGQSLARGGICTGCENPQMQQMHGPRGRYFRCGMCGKLSNEGYDAVLLDEAQDLTPCQFEALGGSEGARGESVIYLIGDRRQRIYGWRGAVGSFEQAECAVEFDLTQSFRFGKRIGAAATMVLQHGGSNEVVRGVAAHRGAVLQDPGHGHGTVTIIARSNKGMIEALWELICSGVQEGKFLPPWTFVDDSQQCAGLLDFSKYTELLKLYKSTGMQDEEPEDEAMADVVVRRQGACFTQWAELKEWAEEVEDADLVTLMAMIEKFGQTLEEVLRVLKASKALPGDEAAVQLVTAHKSKGLEFAQVLLADDYKLPVDEGKLRAVAGKNLEEINVLHVAMTRVMRTLYVKPATWAYFQLLKAAASEGDGQYPAQDDDEDDEDGDENEDESEGEASGGSSDAVLVHRRRELLGAISHSRDALLVVRNDYESRWSAFENQYPKTDRPPEVAVRNVPWPPFFERFPGCKNIFALHPEDLADEVGKMVVRAVVNYLVDVKARKENGKIVQDVAKGLNLVLMAGKVVQRFPCVGTGS